MCSAGLRSLKSDTQKCTEGGLKVCIAKPPSSISISVA